MFRYNTQGEYIIKKSLQDKPVENFSSLSSIRSALVLATNCRPTLERANKCKHNCECKSGKCTWWSSSSIKKYNKTAVKTIKPYDYGNKCN
jgi:hypothetical protein